MALEQTVAAASVAAMAAVLAALCFVPKGDTGPSYIVAPV